MGGSILILDNMRYMHGRLPAVNGLTFFEGFAAQNL